MDEYSLWKATEWLKQPTERNPPITKADQTWTRNDIGKANIFAEDLGKTFKGDVLP
jgi:hypothetical protein